MDKKIKSAREIKEEKVDILADKIGKAKSITFSNYHGLSANQISNLRTQIKKSGGEFLVEKNSLIGLALKKNKLEAPADQLLGPTAATIAFEDEVAPIKDIAKSNKETGFPIFKFGFFGEDYINEKDLGKLALIPGREILQANLVGSLASPIFGFVYVLKANMNSIVYALSEIQKQKGGES